LQALTGKSLERDHTARVLLNSTLLSTICCSADVQYDSFEYVRMDATVAERLTASPRVFDIYGYCGLSILSEFFPHGDFEQAAVPDGDGYFSSEDMQKMDFHPQNNLTGIEKLRIGTQMAEALVDLHGYRDGVIVHGDVQLSQFLYTADKSIVKINDFNRAEFVLWDDKNEKYCTYRNGHGNGNVRIEFTENFISSCLLSHIKGARCFFVFMVYQWRSPEEYFDSPLTEQVDVWSLGNNLYSLLTGVWPFYDEEETEKMQVRIPILFFADMCLMCQLTLLCPSKFMTSDFVAFTESSQGA
jgi:serine/threonine protein kinase